MSVNKTQLHLGNRLKNTLKRHERNFRELKTPQPAGGDVVRVQGIPDNNQFFLTQLTVGAGGIGDFVYSIQPVNRTLTLWNFAWTLYVDPTTFQTSGVPTLDWEWANGSSLSNAQRSDIRPVPLLNWAESNDLTNERMFKVSVLNTDSINHVCYVAARFYLPDLNQ